MTKLMLVRSIIICLFLTTLSLQSEAQTRSSRSKRPPEPEKIPLKDRLWYGGGFALGFYGGTISGIQSSEFFVGVSPMVGYKINDFLSFGPRLELNLLTGRYDLGRDVEKLTAFNYGAGLFTRARFFEVMFGHVEYGYINQAVPYFENGEIKTDRLGSDQFLLGLGYNSGYPFGTEIYILYDFLAPEDTVNLPITFRFGFTYKFQS